MRGDVADATHCALCAGPVLIPTALESLPAAHNLRADLYLASVYVRVMRTTTEEITRSWLLPEMVSRVASMLDYFLDHLAGGHYSESRPLPGHHLQAGHDAHTEQPVTNRKIGRGHLSRRRYHVAQLDRAGQQWLL